MFPLFVIKIMILPNHAGRRHAQPAFRESSLRGKLISFERDRDKGRYNVVSSRSDSTPWHTEKTTNFKTNGTVISTPDMTNLQPFLSRILFTLVSHLTLSRASSILPLLRRKQAKGTVQNILSYFPSEFSFTAGPMWNHQAM